MYTTNRPRLPDVEPNGKRWVVIKGGVSSAVASPRLIVACTGVGVSASASRKSVIAQSRSDAKHFDQEADLHT